MIRFRCSKCGAVLAEWPSPKFKYYGIPEPPVLAMYLGGRCPRCGAELRGRVVKVVVDGEELEV